MEYDAGSLIKKQLELRAIMIEDMQEYFIKNSEKFEGMTISTMKEIIYYQEINLNKAMTSLVHWMKENSK